MSKSNGNETINKMAVKTKKYLEDKKNQPVVIGASVFGVSTLLFSGILLPIVLGAGTTYFIKKEQNK